MVGKTSSSSLSLSPTLLHRLFSLPSSLHTDRRLVLPNEADSRSRRVESRLYGQAEYVHRARLCVNGSSISVAGRLHCGAFMCQRFQVQIEKQRKSQNDHSAQTLLLLSRLTSSHKNTAGVSNQSSARRSGPTEPKMAGEVFLEMDYQQ